MAKKTRKPPARKTVAKRKPRAVKAIKTKRAAAPRKKIVRQKKAAAKKPASVLKRIENAIVVGVAEADELAISLGYLAASDPPPKKRKKARKKARR